MRSRLKRNRKVFVISEQEINDIKTRCEEQGLGCKINLGEFIVGQVGQAINKAAYFVYDDLVKTVEINHKDPSTNLLCARSDIQDVTDAYFAKVAVVIKDYYKEKNITSKSQLNKRVAAFKKALAMKSQAEMQRERLEMEKKTAEEAWNEKNYNYLLFICPEVINYSNESLFLKEIITWIEQNDNRENSNQIPNENTTLLQNANSAKILFTDTAALLLQHKKTLNALKNNDVPTIRHELEQHDIQTKNYVDKHASRARSVILFKKWLMGTLTTVIVALGWASLGFLVAGPIGGICVGVATLLYCGAFSYSFLKYKNHNMTFEQTDSVDKNIYKFTQKIDYIVNAHPNKPPGRNFSCIPN